MQNLIVVCRIGNRQDVTEIILYSNHTLTYLYVYCVFYYRPTQLRVILPYIEINYV